MSAYSGSSTRLGLVALLLATSVLPAAAAKVTVSSDVHGKPIRVSREIDISDRGIRIAIDGDSLDWTDVRDSHGGSVRIGPGSFTVDGDGSGLVRLFADARVDADEVIQGDVVAVFGDVRVDGKVDGSTVAVFGSVTLGDSAVVTGDAVSVWGGLHVPDGARINGESVGIGFMPLTLGLPALPVVLATILLGWLVTVFFGWVIGLLFPERLSRIAETASNRTAASLALGLVSGPLFLLAGVLLMVTVIGIPLAVLLPLAYIAAIYVGQIASTSLLGSKLLRQRAGLRSHTASVAAGAMLVAALFVIGAVLWAMPGVARTVALFFNLLAGLLLVGLSAIGTGAVLLSRVGGRVSSGHHHGDSSVPRAPQPPPAAAPGPVPTA